MPEPATATKEKVHPLVAFRGYLQDRTDSLRTALPPHIKPERFISAVMTAVQINPDLLACERRSLFVACMRCAQDGLMPDNTEAAIVPFKDKAQYLVMYQGLLRKFRNSGSFRWITAGIAYEGEEYSHWIDETGEHFRHVPSNNHPNAKIKRVYALATTKDGGSFIAALSLADINKRRAMSRASRDDAPWRLWEPEMMKKTALRVLSKLLPKSSDVDAFLQRDEAESLGVTPAIPEPHSFDDFAEPPPSALDQQKTVAAEAEPRGAPQGTATAQSRDPATAPLDIAYRRGFEARNAGVQRRAIPPEYRETKQQREAVCWQAGYDGNPMPSFSEKET